jgi:hypothetical protein
MFPATIAPMANQPRHDHRAILVRLRHEILAPLGATGGRLPTNRALAQRFGVHGTTIAKAMQVLVHEGLVQRRVGDGSYALPQSDGTAAPYWVLYHTAVPSDDRPEARFSSMLDAALQDEAAVRRLPVRHLVDLRRGPGPWQAPDELLAAVAAGRVAGVLAMQPRANDADAWLDELPVGVWQLGVDRGQGSVRLDLHQAGCAAAELLLQGGAQRPLLLPATLHDDLFPAAARRWTTPLRNGINTVLAAHGLPGCPPSSAATLPPSLTTGPWHHLRIGAELLRHAWQRPQRPDAIIAATDILARGAVAALRGFGLEPGRDLPVVVLANDDVDWPDLDGCLCLRLQARQVAAALLDVATAGGGERLVPYGVPVLGRTP